MSENRLVCTFLIDKHFFGVDVSHVQEVIQYQEVTTVPLAPNEVGGLINLRGEVVTAIDLRRRLQLKTRPPEELPFNVVVRTSNGAISLQVDHIEDIIEVNDDIFEPPPETLRSEIRKLISGAYKLESSLLLLLNIEAATNLDFQKRMNADDNPRTPQATI